MQARTNRSPARQVHARSVPAARRASAIVAILVIVAVLAIVGVVLARQLLWLVAAVLCLAVAISAAAYAITRTGGRRMVATVVAVAALAAPLMLVVAYGRLLQLLFVITLLAVAGAATRYALGRDIKSLKSGPTPGANVGPAARAVLLMNPKSGGGKVERFRLAEEARRRGIEPAVLAQGDDLLRLAERAVAQGADVVGMAGGDGSQALVASVAMRHNVGFVCVPAGTRNHLAMDLGLDREDVVGALDAFGEAVERRIDLGMIGDRVFVNNATVGLYAKIVQSPAYRDRKVGTALEMLPAMLGPDAVPFDLRFTGPDGTEHLSAHLILVSNDRYELGRAEGFGSRRCIDAVPWGSSRPHSSLPRTPPRWRNSRPPGGPVARTAGWSGPTRPSRCAPASRWRSASTGRRCCWTRRSGSGSSPVCCGFGSRATLRATPPPPLCHPRAGRRLPRCCRPPPVDRSPSSHD
jgi:Diacylglycerol kinase catalytic domain